MIRNDYPPAIPIIDYDKTWINVKTKNLRSKELPKYKYSYISSKFNPISKEVEYFIILGDNLFDEDKNKIYHKIDDWGVATISLHKFWDELGLNHYKHNIQVSLILVKKDDNGEVYKIAI